jgi:XRE family aerobic/anaerobic benzoate catabolism transcriptional regulator
MADNRESMEDLQRILSVREPLYGKADVAIDTSSHSLAQSVRLVLEARTGAVEQEQTSPTGRA